MISLNSLKLIFPIVLDYKSLMFLGTVFLISSIVILYSHSYIYGGISSLRFLSVLILFVFSIMFLILSPCLVSVLLGWDGLGLTSYCLVIFYQNQKSSSSGIITALTNRVGDVFILIRIGLISRLGSWNFILIYFDCFNLSEFVYLLVILAAITKSAQIPFSAWLPEAIAAPTPVSALVHSSTLVTAGVYLLIRFYPLLMVRKEIMFFLRVVGSSTMVISGLSANNQFDIKKIIALSTLSQLGVIVTSLSLGIVELCFFHLLTHAIFKSLLFMCAGMFIHFNLNRQDIRLFGNSSKFFPLTLVFFNTSNLALCGMPFLSGFYSKDLILELISLSRTNLFIFTIFFFATGLTVCYTIRLIYLSINFKFNYISKVLNLFDLTRQIIFSIFVIFVCSIFLGKFGSYVFLENPYNFIVLPTSLKFLTLMVCFGGGLRGFLIMIYRNKFIDLFLMNWINQMWFLSFVTPSLFKSSSLKVRNLSSKIFTSGWVEEFIGFNLIILVQNTFLNFFVKRSNSLLIIRIAIFIPSFLFLW